MRMPPRGKAPRLATASILLASIILTSCAAQMAQRPVGARLTPTETASLASAPTPTPTQAITFLRPAPSLTFAQAWGKVAIIRLPNLLPNGEVFNGVDDATSDGQWLVGEIEPRNMLNNTTVYPQIALYNVHTRQIRVIRTLRSPQSRLDGVSTDGNWLAWSDSVDPGSFFDWVMYVCDLRTGVVRVLAQAPRADGQAAQGPHSGPFVSNGYVVWTQALGPIAQGDLTSLKQVVVKEENLATDAVTTLATAASVMTFSWPWVAWGQVTSATAGNVMVDNLVTQQRQQLDQEPADIKLDGSAAIIEPDANTVALIPDVSRDLTEQTVFATNPATFTDVGYPSIGHRLLAWIWGSGDHIPVVVWDRVQHVTVVLPTTNAPNATWAWTDDSLLIWLDPEPAAQRQADLAKGLTPLETYCIVSTAQLPTTASSS